MKEHPILFSGPMVRAILEGRKTQTRRVVRFNPNGNIVEPGRRRCWHRDDPDAVQACPYGAPGQTLWVRETWGPFEGGFIYRADEGPNVKPDDGRWRPSIHMPRCASRLSLLIKNVRVERLQEISEADAIAEGISPVVGEYTGPARSEFAALWESINATSHPWVSNPWVWVVEFERVGGGS